MFMSFLTKFKCFFLFSSQMNINSFLPQRRPPDKPPEKLHDDQQEHKDEDRLSNLKYKLRSLFFNFMKKTRNTAVLDVTCGYLTID